MKKHKSHESLLLITQNSFWKHKIHEVKEEHWNSIKHKRN